MTQYMVIGIPMLRMCVPARVQMRNSRGFHFFCLALTLRIPQALARMDTPEQTSHASALVLMTSSFMMERPARAGWGWNGKRCGISRGQRQVPGPNRHSYRDGQSFLWMCWEDGARGTAAWGGSGLGQKKSTCTESQSIAVIILKQKGKARSWKDRYDKKRHWKT